MLLFANHLVNRQAGFCGFSFRFNLISRAKFHTFVFRFPMTVGGVPGSGGSSGSCSRGWWWPATRTNTGRWQWDQPRRRSGGCCVGTCHLRRDDTRNSDTRHRPQRSTKTLARQQHTFSLPRPWPQGNVRGKSYNFFHPTRLLFHYFDAFVFAFADGGLLAFSIVA